VAAICLIVFAPLSPLARANYPIGFLVFPVLVWPVVRFGPRIAATTAAAISIVAVWGTVQGAGPWVRGTANESLLLAQTFMGVATLTSLVVAAAVLERQQALESLRATEERLRRAEEGKVAARDQFLSIAAHELRTPLTSIQLAAQYLLHEMDAGRALNSDRVRAATATLASQTERFGALISQLLDTVRVQMSRMDLSISDQDVAEIARRAAHEMQAITTRHEIRVDADGPVRAAIDPIRIEQVLRNLLDNAVKFSPGGEIAVGVGSDDGHVIVDVRDHGPGIPPEARERIFDRFYQARPDSRDRGLGLGLHVSRHIVELHGGTIAAEFPADGGTRIVVRLPARVAAAPELEEALR
jgi:signal transduction histidine kinase